MASAVIAATQQPDPSEAGLFDKPLVVRQRGYQMLDSEYTCVLFTHDSGIQKPEFRKGRSNMATTRLRCIM